jgi:hypothetical protein
MAGPVSNFNFMALANPAFAAKQAYAQQQAQLAQQLMKDGSTPQDPAHMANPGGLIVPVSKWGALAKTLEQGIGSYLNKDATTQQVQAYQGLQGGDSGPGVLSSGQPTSGQALMGQATNAAIGSENNSSDPNNPTQGPASAQDVATQYQGLAQQLANPYTGPEITDNDAQPNAAIAQQLGNPQTAINDPQFMRDAMVVGPEDAYKGYLARNSTPDAVKVANYANNGNIDAARAALAAELQAKGIHEDRAGSSSTNLLTGQKTFNPIVPAGAAPQYDAAGQAIGVAPLPIMGAPFPPQGAAPQTPAATAPVLPPTLQQGIQNQASPASFNNPAPPLANPAITPQSPAGQNALGDMYGTPPNSPNIPPPLPGTNPTPMSPQGNGGPVVLNASSGPANATSAPSQLPPDFPKPSAPAQMTITPADTGAATDNAKATIQRNNDVLTAAQTSPTRMSDLQKIYGLAQTSTKFGPGADKASYYKGLSQQIPGINPSNDDATNYEVAKKYFSNLSGQYQKALGGTGTDKQLDIAMSGTPGPDMLNQAITKVAPFLMGQEKALQAQANMRRSVTNPANGYKNPTQDLQNLEGYWQKNYDPDAFELASIPPAQRPAFIQSLSPADAAKLGGDGKNDKGSYQKALEAGWIQ